MHFVVWTGVEEWLSEAAAVELSDSGLRATGVQLGADPAPYRIDYRLDAANGFVTRELDLTGTGEGWRRRLELRHDRSGGWRADLEDEGDVPGGPWDGELPDLSDARDIDIGFSPLTNSMPVLRHGLHRDGSRDFVMAWIEVPQLRVVAKRQRYEHVRAGQDGAIVRFLDGESDFSAELELGRDRLLLHYPGLARRVLAREMAAGTH
jgi:hypothetical protein